MELDHYKVVFEGQCTLTCARPRHADLNGVTKKCTSSVLYCKKK